MKSSLILISCISTITLCSCKKLLDLQPTDVTTTQTFYQNQAQVENALNAVYAPMKNIDMGEYYVEFDNAPTDEGYFYNAAQDGPATFQNFSTNQYTTGFWTASYTAINYANTLLDNIDNAVGLDPTYKKRAIGQALFLRAHYLFNLVRLYGDIPMPLTSLPDYHISRTPVKEVYNQIISDMVKAEGMLTGYTSTSLGYAERVTQDAVQGILARVCLYAAGQPANDVARYADALFWANKVKESGHSLIPDFKQVFTNYIQDKYDVRESIWEVGYAYGTTTTTTTSGIIGIYWGITQTYTPAVGGTTVFDSGYVYGYEKVHPRLYNAYQPGDLRRDWTIGNYVYLNNSAFQGKVGLTSAQLWERMPNKFRRELETPLTRSVQRANATNLPLLRYSDVLLMLAEAENEVNGATAVAYDAINTVRRRAISPTRIVDNISMVTTGSGYTSIPNVSITSGGGTGLSVGVYLLSAASPAGAISLVVNNQGSGFTSAPVITIGNQWAAATAYAVGTQVAAGGRLYTVTTAGTSTATMPTNTSGASTAASTGAVFTYAGIAATAVATISALPVVDLTPGLSKDAFRKAVQDERYRELAYEYHRLGDLKRWGILVSTIKSLGDDINGNVPGIPAAPAVNFTPAIVPVNSVSFRDIYWPIPLRDLQLNSNLTQNPGY
jgi:hypothetical protein